MAYSASSRRAPAVAPDVLFPRAWWSVAVSVTPVVLLGLLTALGWRHFVAGMDAGGVVTIPKAPAVLTVCMVTGLGMLELTLAEWWRYVRGNDPEGVEARRLWRSLHGLAARPLYVVLVVLVIAWLTRQAYPLGKTESVTLLGAALALFGLDLLKDWFKTGLDEFRLLRRYVASRAEGRGWLSTFTPAVAYLLLASIFHAALFLDAIREQDYQVWVAGAAVIWGVWLLAVHGCAKLRAGWRRPAVNDAVPTDSPRLGRPA